MEMQQVRYFLAVAKELNFTRAAEQCNVSQPSLTRAIQSLEHELGGPLLRREGRLSHLTELGERMLPLLRQCYQSAIAAKEIATAVKKGDITTLAIAVAPAIDIELLMPPLNEMFSKFTGLQLRIVRGTGPAISELLKSGKIDIAVSDSLGESWDRLEASPMFTEPYNIVVGVGHQLALSEDVSIDSALLAREKLLLLDDLNLTQSDQEQLSAVGLNLYHAHIVDTVSDLQALLAQNLGLSVAPRSSFRAKSLRKFTCHNLDLRRTVTIYTVAGRQRSREVAVLHNLLRATDWAEQLELA